MALTAWIAADLLRSRGAVVDPANRDEAFGRPHREPHVVMEVSQARVHS
jgi:hypothetical protein